jgi:hypothetical protein
VVLFGGHNDARRLAVYQEDSPFTPLLEQRCVFLNDPLVFRVVSSSIERFEVIVGVDDLYMIVVGAVLSLEDPLAFGDDRPFRHFFRPRLWCVRELGNPVQLSDPFKFPPLALHLSYGRPDKHAVAQVRVGPEKHGLLEFVHTIHVVATQLWLVSDLRG